MFLFRTLKRFKKINALNIKGKHHLSVKHNMIIHFDSQVMSLIYRKITVCIQLFFFFCIPSIAIWGRIVKPREMKMSEFWQIIWKVLLHWYWIRNLTTEESIYGLLSSERKQVHKIVITEIRKKDKYYGLIMVRIYHEKWTNRLSSFLKGKEKRCP